MCARFAGGVSPYPHWSANANTYLEWTYNAPATRHTSKEKHHGTRIRKPAPERTTTPNTPRQRRTRLLRTTHLHPHTPMDTTRHTMGTRAQQQSHRMDRPSTRRLQPTRRRSQRRTCHSSTQTRHTPTRPAHRLSRLVTNGGRGSPSQHVRTVCPASHLVLSVAFFHKAMLRLLTFPTRWVV